MIISDALLDKINEDPISVCLEVCQLSNHPTNRADPDAQLEVCLFLGAMVDGGILDFKEIFLALKMGRSIGRYLLTSLGLCRPKSRH